MPPSDFKNASVSDVVEQLTTDEAILLTAGVGFWHTYGVPRLGIPALKVSDGPNGMLQLSPIVNLPLIFLSQAFAETTS